MATSVSGSTAKKLDGINKKAKKVRVFLLGQLGKNDAVLSHINMEAILSLVYSTLLVAHEAVGGRAIFLECKDTPKLVELYEKHGFKKLQKDEYQQMYKILDFKTG